MKVRSHVSWLRQVGQTLVKGDLNCFSPHREIYGRIWFLSNHSQQICSFLLSFLVFWQKQGGDSTQCHLPYVYRASQEYVIYEMEDLKKDICFFSQKSIKVGF